MNTQQRRPFFQAATSNGDRLAKAAPSWKRCFRPCGWIVATLSAALLILGCTSLTPDRVNVIAGIAGQAAQVGTEAWLKKHPEHKASFDAVLAALIALQKAGNTNEAAYVELLSSLPTDALKGPDGELYVAGDGGLVVWDGKLKKSVTVRGPSTVPVIKATLSGLKRGTRPKLVPPTPTAKLALPPGVVIKDLEGALTIPLAGFRNAHALTLTNSILHQQTLLVASTFDVTLNEHGIQQVNVRWAQTQGYFTVQRQEHQQTETAWGTAWEGWASVTNAGVWTTLWPAQAPVGAWRVVRQ